MSGRRKLTKDTGRDMWMSYSKCDKKNDKRRYLFCLLTEYFKHIEGFATLVRPAPFEGSFQHLNLKRPR